MGLIAFAVEVIIAYFLGIVLFYVGVFFLGALLAIGAGIYFAFKWIMAHLYEITAGIGTIALIIYLLIFIKRKRVIPRAYQAVKGRLSFTGKIISKAVRLIKEWNERNKPKDIKSIRKYGFVSFLIGIIGAVIFYLNGLWYIFILSALDNKRYISSPISSKSIRADEKISGSCLK